MDVAARIEQQRPRVHILTGAVCNNNCIFCMEEDRDGRYVVNSATSDDSVRWILGRQAHYEEVCFTSGEPTTNQRLPALDRHGEGRRRPPHQHDDQRPRPQLRALHPRPARRRPQPRLHQHPRPHAKAPRRPHPHPRQLRSDRRRHRRVARYKRHGVALHTSTVVTKRNLPHLADIYAFLRAHGVQQVVFNVMQANGRANTYFDQLFPTYTEIAAAAESFLADAAPASARSRPSSSTSRCARPPACPTSTAATSRTTTTSSRRTPATTSSPTPSSAAPASTASSSRSAAATSTTAPATSAPSAPLPHDRVCEGVWGNYLRRHGWDEFEPVP
jgi:hypothetical protein